MKKKGRFFRRSVQVFFLLLITLIAISHTLEEQGIEIPLVGSASLHAVCPFGGVVSLYQYATTGTFTKKIHESSFILMIIVFSLALAFGPVFCGWICPLGTMQEFISRLGRRIFGKGHNSFIPPAVDRYLRYLRYLVLGWVIYASAVSGVLIFADYDPYFALFNFWTGEIAISAFVILGLVLSASLFIERPFCKYACPYGALLGLFNLIRIFGIRRNPATCINCKACDRACPMNIKVSTAGRVRDHQCISCLECSSEKACPIPATVELSVGTMHVQQKEL